MLLSDRLVISCTSDIQNCCKSEVFALPSSGVIISCMSDAQIFTLPRKQIVICSPRILKNCSGVFRWCCCGCGGGVGVGCSVDCGGRWFGRWLLVLSLVWLQLLLRLGL